MLWRCNCDVLRGSCLFVILLYFCVSLSQRSVCDCNNKYCIALYRRYWSVRDAVCPSQNQLHPISSVWGTGSTATHRNYVVWHVTSYVGNVDRIGRCKRHLSATFSSSPLPASPLFLYSGNLSIMLPFILSVNIIRTTTVAELRLVVLMVCV